MLKLLSVWSFEIVITIVSMIFAYYIFAFYYSSSRSMKSRFLSRLTMFSGIFLVQTIITTISSIFLSMKYNEVVAIPMLVISLLELIGFIFLFWVIKE